MWEKSDVQPISGNFSSALYEDSLSENLVCSVQIILQNCMTRIRQGIRVRSLSLTRAPATLRHEAPLNRSGRLTQRAGAPKPTAYDGVDAASIPILDTTTADLRPVLSSLTLFRLASRSPSLDTYRSPAFARRRAPHT